MVTVWPLCPQSLPLWSWKAFKDPRGFLCEIQTSAWLKRLVQVQGQALLNSPTLLPVGAPFSPAVSKCVSFLSSFCRLCPFHTLLTFPGAPSPLLHLLFTPKHPVQMPPFPKGIPKTPRAIVIPEAPRISTFSTVPRQSQEDTRPWAGPGFWYACSNSSPRTF